MQFGEMWFQNTQSRNFSLGLFKNRWDSNLKTVDFLKDMEQLAPWEHNKIQIDNFPVSSKIWEIFPCPTFKL